MSPSLASRRNELTRLPWSPGYFPKAEWEFSTNTQDEPSTVASIQAPRALWLREDQEAEIVVPAYDQITSDGSGTTSTYSLSSNVIDSPATQSVVLWSEGSVVSPSNYSVDYANDSIDYADGGAAEELDIYYVPREPAVVEFVKRKPGGSGKMEQPLFEKALSVLHTRDQNEDPVSFDLNKTPLQPFVPRKWELAMKVDAPYDIRYSEDARGTRATNALQAIPRHQSDQRLPGLKNDVKADVAGVQ